MLAIHKILIFTLICFILVELTFEKNAYSNFLNEDNELILIEDNKISKNLNKKSTNQNVLKNNSEIVKKEQNKLIVNIVYASKDKIKKNPSSSSSSISSNQLIYITDVSSPCNKINLCKPNEICLVVSNNSNNYKCIQLSTKSTFKAKISKITSNYSNNQCNSDILNKFKLNLYKMIESSYSKMQLSNNKQKEREHHMKLSTITTSKYVCHESVDKAFYQIDSNNDQSIFLSELISFYKVKNITNELCLNELFHNCNQNKDNILNFDEFCQCFQNFQPKCNFIRNQLNLNSRIQYISHVNRMLLNSITKTPVQIRNVGLELDAKNYVPLCDSNGYFLPTQCDSDVNCWCVSKIGEPIQNTFRKIHQNTIDCNNII